LQKPSLSSLIHGIDNGILKNLEHALPYPLADIDKQWGRKQCFYEVLWVGILLDLRYGLFIGEAKFVFDDHCAND
jgi:hypothetical protein